MKTLIKYCFVGGFGALIQVSLTWLLVSRLAYYYLFGSVIAFLVSLCISFLLQRFWTFASVDPTHSIEVMSAMYALTSLVGLGLNVVLLFILVHLAQLPIIPSQIISIVLVALTNFILNSKITFKERKL